MSAWEWTIIYQGRTDFSPVTSNPHLSLILKPPTAVHCRIGSAVGHSFNSEKQMQEFKCRHERVHCLNQFELIRKYRCEDCGAVMMCACDEERGKAFLAHQLDHGTELETQRRVRVTDGFQPELCVECRGLPAEPHPVAAIFGRTTKILRYYWRELFFREAELFEEWRRGQEGEVNEWCTKAIEVKEGLHKLALEEMKALHLALPKYSYSRVSPEETIRKYSVEVMTLQGQYVREEGQKKARVMDEGEAVPVEEFVKRHFERNGHQALILESRPFHVLFGVFFFADSRSR